VLKILTARRRIADLLTPKMNDFIHHQGHEDTTDEYKRFSSCPSCAWWLTIRDLDFPDSQIGNSPGTDGYGLSFGGGAGWFWTEWAGEDGLPALIRRHNALFLNQSRPLPMVSSYSSILSLDPPAQMYRSTSGSAFRPLPNRLNASSFNVL
jgi:hypothetical protein